MIETIAWVALILGIVSILWHIKNEWWDIRGIYGPKEKADLHDVFIDEKGLHFVIELPEELETGENPEED
jgi:hypothetical protein